MVSVPVPSRPSWVKVGTHFVSHNVRNPLTGDVKVISQFRYSPSKRRVMRNNRVTVVPIGVGSGWVCRTLDGCLSIPSRITRREDLLGRYGLSSFRVI